MAGQEPFTIVHRMMQGCWVLSALENQLSARALKNECAFCFLFLIEKVNNFICFL